MKFYTNQPEPKRDMDKSKATHITKRGMRYVIGSGKTLMWHIRLGWIPSQLSQRQLAEMVEEGDLVPV